MCNNCLIFILDYDFEYGKHIITRFAQENFYSVIRFTDEKECMDSIKMKPDVVITGYQLKSMTGLDFIQKAKAIHPDFFAILLSGEFYQDFLKVGDKLVFYVDKLIIKGMDDMNEIIDTLKDYQVEEG
jgi:YesN/AraC family two-component response regulator